jgi:ADP-heptose:LPS heptosyltransferase
MNKILILKNDRVGDLFNSLDGINAILKDNPTAKIEIVLSQISRKLSFLFNINNVTVSYLPYHLNFTDKFRLFIKILNNSFDKIYILSPKNFYYYLPLFFKSKFYAITIKNSSKSRPFNFLLKRLFRYETNNRDYKKINDSISSLIFNLCSTKPISSYNNILNNIPQCSPLFQKNVSLFSNFIHIHYKDSIFKNNNWSTESFAKILDSISRKNKVLFTSDYGNFRYQNFFLSNYSHLDFPNEIDKINSNKNIHYLHNIDTCDLFKLISLSNTVISPHGTMTLMASYFKKKVIDIFDSNVTINAFREYKPYNKNYNFFIINPDSDKILRKINKFL